MDDEFGNHRVVEDLCISSNSGEWYFSRENCDEKSARLAPVLTLISSPLPNPVSMRTLSETAGGLTCRSNPVSGKKLLWKYSTRSVKERSARGLPQGIISRLSLLARVLGIDAALECVTVAFDFRLLERDRVAGGDLRGQCVSAGYAERWMACPRTSSCHDTRSTLVMACIRCKRGQYRRRGQHKYQPVSRTSVTGCSTCRRVFISMK